MNDCTQYLLFGGGGEGIDGSELALLVDINDQDSGVSLFQEVIDDHHVIVHTHHLGPLVIFLIEKTNKMLVSLLKIFFFFFLCACTQITRTSLVARQHCKVTCLPYRLDTEP